MSSEQPITSVAILIAAAAALSIAGCDKPPSMPPEEPGAVDVDDEGDDDRVSDDHANESDDHAEPLSKANFDEVINDHFDEISDCYIAALEGAPELQGRFNAEFTIGGEGRVIGLVAVDGSTLDDPGMIACITEAAASWQFAQPTATNMTLPYTFNLAPG